MTRSQIFPTILIALDLCASVMYAIDGDWRKVVYWVSASILTASVTF